MSHETAWSVADLDRKPESFKRRNPHLYAAVGGLVPAKRKPNPKPALDQNQKPQKDGRQGPCIIITLVACRERLLDDDNSIAGFKGLRDTLCRLVGIDDADPRIRFQYGQVISAGMAGTIVRIERIVI